MEYGLLALLIIGGLALSIAITGGLVWIVCWAFGLTFTWKMVAGVWAVMGLLRMVMYSDREES